MADEVTTNNPEHTVRLERILPAARERVFSAFVDPAQLSNWWGPAGFTVPNAVLDVREGGRYRIEMQPSDGEPFWAFGEYREVEPPGRLVYTFEWDPPTPDDQPTLVTLALEPAEEGTRLVVEHGAFKTDERYALHEAGWRDTLDRLEAWVAANPGRSGSD
jgi:uncharacterized protein YndB with AHSA1/START domain